VLLVGRLKELQPRLQPWLARELEPNRKLFYDHLLFILHGALMGADQPFFWQKFAKMSHTQRPCDNPIVKIGQKFGLVHLNLLVISGTITTIKIF
jgi:hypothetical protein